MTKAKIPLAGVIGSPIAHSKSPALHGHWLETYQIDGFYVPMDVAPEDLSQVLLSLPKAGFVGVNVTIPHKEQALKIADVVSERAKRIGAANTLTFDSSGKILADNTDGYGFLENLKTGVADWVPEAGRAVVLGAGGAARGVIVALLDAGVPKIILSNRTRSRAEALQKEFGHRIDIAPWNSISDHLGDTVLLVNTSSLGMTGEPPLPVSLDRLGSDTIVTDLVYTPLETDLLISAKAKGCRTVDGLGMLLHQGVPGFERWFGTRPDVSDATRTAVLG